MNDIEAIKLLIKIKELGITDEQIANFKERHQVTETVMADADSMLRQLFPEDITDEEIMYYATPYYDELQAKKQLKEQQTKDQIQ